MSTIAQYTADGVTAVYGAPSAYLARSHVVVSVNGVPKIDDVHYDWINASQISFRPQFVPPAHALVEVRRNTPISTALVTYHNGAVLTQEDLNTGVLQSLYVAEELRDFYESRLNASAVRLSNGNFTNAQNLIDAAVADILNSALLADLQSRISDIDASAEVILEHDVRLTTLQGLIDALTGDGGGIATLITNETNARIVGDTALVDTLALIGAKNGANTAFIADLNKLMVSPTESFGQRFTALSTADTNNAAAITTEQTARINGDSAEATLRTALAARVTTAEGGISSNSAAITSEQTARVNGDNAVASSVSTLSTTVSGHTTAIQTNATSINGLEGKYTVKVDANGYVAGFGLAVNANTAAPTSEFIVLASKFAVVTPGAPAKVPFVISGGVCYLQNVVIQDALIENLTVGKLTSGTLVATITQNADINVGTGRIIWNNGAYMKVAGVGFGTAGQFIEWFGAVRAINTCSEANAISYLKTNGSAYFGGSLSAGVLKTSGATSDTSATAQISIGPFGSNGNPISVVLSYTEQAFGTVAGSLQNQSWPISATVTLYRKIGTGSEAAVATLNVSGSAATGAQYNDGGSKCDYSQSMSASTTYTDNAGGALDRTYRAQITARTLQFAVGGQNVTLVATE